MPIQRLARTWSITDARARTMPPEPHESCLRRVGLAFSDCATTAVVAPELGVTRARRSRCSAMDGRHAEKTEDELRPSSFAALAAALCVLLARPTPRHAMSRKF